jgi:hypothetical protein
MSTKRKKTVLRTVRLTHEMNALLQDEAEASGLTVNGLINRILTKYLEWDTHVEKFKFVSIASETFKAVLEACGDDRVEQIGTDLGSKMPVGVTLFWFKKLNFETVLKTISNFGKYSGLQTNEIKVEDDKCTIVFHHGLGEKWSIFLKGFISQFLKTALRTVPHAETTYNTVFVSFNLPHQRNSQTSEHTALLKTT